MADTDTPTNTDTLTILVAHLLVTHLQTQAQTQTHLTLYPACAHMAVRMTTCEKQMLTTPYIQILISETGLEGESASGCQHYLLSLGCSINARSFEREVGEWWSNGEVSQQSPIYSMFCHDTIYVSVSSVPPVDTAGIRDSVRCRLGLIRYGSDTVWISNGMDIIRYESDTVRGMLHSRLGCS